MENQNKKQMIKSIRSCYLDSIFKYICYKSEQETKYNKFRGIPNIKTQERKRKVENIKDFKEFKKYIHQNYKFYNLSD